MLEMTVQACKILNAEDAEGFPDGFLQGCRIYARGTDSSSTLTASVRMPRELRKIRTPIKNETTGSAMTDPVSGTVRPTEH